METYLTAGCPVLLNISTWRQFKGQHATFLEASQFFTVGSIKEILKSQTILSWNWPTRMKSNSWPCTAEPQHPYHVLELCQAHGLGSWPFPGKPVPVFNLSGKNFFLISNINLPDTAPSRSLGSCQWSHRTEIDTAPQEEHADSDEPSLGLLFSSWRSQVTSAISHMASPSETLCSSFRCFLRALYPSDIVLPKTGYRTQSEATSQKRAESDNAGQQSRTQLAILFARAYGSALSFN